MDREIRNRIQRATQAARELLQHEYAEQLEGLFDVRLDGTIMAEPGGHLDAAQRVVRTKLVTAVEHQRAAGMTHADAVASYLREAAFTTLNRFVALKMLEARELAQECISRGDQSAGFKEFTGLAPGLVQLPDHGYRIYVESLFDEIGREVRVLFDRRDPASLLWPRRQGLLDLLGILNAPELAAVWDEDETIGWVYQYFNSDDERKQMRAESQAPRNSRELAVRNQFFTPRFVVRFLTDNTLGRIWYEMRQGETQLRDLDYLVRRPNEVFLSAGEVPPANPDAGDNLTQEELLERPVHVPFREKRDPRDIRILDPACGSGHFLLYAFDLLGTIYEEAWTDPAHPRSQLTGRTLHEDYLEIETLRASVPGLILRHNLHGIDIDDRCAQIAALALWMRAQRAYGSTSIPPDARPFIQKTNIVVAEPMPGTPKLREEFLATLAPELCQLVTRVIDRMAPAGRAGSLLPIEETIRDVVREVFPSSPGELLRQLDEKKWLQAEAELLRALRHYAVRAVSGQAYQRQLFTEDAARGLGFIDMCGQSYDVVLMNPPFGAFVEGLREWSATKWPRTKNDIYAAFVERGLGLLKPQGRLGAITSRTGFFLTTFQQWREEVVLHDAAPTEFADLGSGVMDSAMVEAAAYCIEVGSQREGGTFFRVLDDSDKGGKLRRLIKSQAAHPERFLVAPRTFRTIPGTPFAYWISARVRQLFSELEPFERGERIVRQGGVTGDDTRFLRAHWEVPVSGPTGTCEWVPFAKGGTLNDWYADYPVVVGWHRSRDTFWGYTGLKHRPSIKPSSVDHYFRPGVTWPLRAARFAPVILPAGSIFSIRGYAILAPEDELLPILAIAKSSIFDYQFKILLGRVGFPEFVVGVLQKLPFPVIPERAARSLADFAKRAFQTKRRLHTWLEDSHAFLLPALLQMEGSTLGERASNWAQHVRSLEVQLEAIQRGVDDVCFSLYGIDDDERVRIMQGFGISQVSNEGTATPGDDDESEPSDVDAESLVGSLLSWTVGVCFGRFDLSLATGERLLPAAPEPFAALPRCSPGMLTDTHGVPMGTKPRDYPIDFPLAGVLVDDQGHERDFFASVRSVFEVVFGDTADANWREASWLLDPRRGDLHSWFSRQYFEQHIKHYSKSRRKAPIYWQLATPSASYSVWLYYHRVTRDTLYGVLNYHVVPKFAHEERRLSELAQATAVGPLTSQRKELEAQEAMVSELRTFRDEVARVAPLWNPNLNDGVIINFAPLWRLLSHNRSWQKECKSTWDKLCNGDYDWAHHAMHLWPERVVPKCAKGRSLAIAHGLEDVFWYEDAGGKWRHRKVDQTEVHKLIKDRTSASVKDALKGLLEAPALATGRASRKKAPRAKGSRKKTASTPPRAATNGASLPSRSPAAADAELLSKVKDAIGANGDGASKADVIDATGISTSEWNKTIMALLADGSVTQSGARRGARYHLEGGDA